MALKINITWPRHLPQICIPIDCSDIEIASRTATRLDEHILIDSAFNEHNRVRDDDRYRIDSQCSGPLKYSERNAPYRQTLVIVLESPDKDEFLGNCIDRPIAPAVGATGRNIRCRLMDVINTCDHIQECLHQETRVILANPIQFQTSLVSILRITSNDKDKRAKLRDAVWNAIWSYEEIRCEFKKRLKGYSPDLLINACTHDVGCNSKVCPLNGECKKDKVREFLTSNFAHAHIYEATHPCTWHSKKHRGLAQI